MHPLAQIDIPSLHDGALTQWYAQAPASCDPQSDLASLIQAQHFRNFTLWNLEDEARRRQVSDSFIASIKRSIDPVNQSRNDLMERIDQAILSAFAAVDLRASEQHSETAGMMVDRLSILALKIWHMGRNAERATDDQLRQECGDKAAILAVQRADLAQCLTRLLEQFAGGKRHFKSYRQFKQYNDPRLNPALRAEGQGVPPGKS